MDSLSFIPRFGGSINAMLTDALTGITFDRVEQPLPLTHYIFMTGSNNLTSRLSVSGLVMEDGVPKSGTLTAVNIFWGDDLILGITFSRQVTIEEVLPLAAAAGAGDFGPIDAFMASFRLTLNAHAALAGVQFVAGDTDDSLFGSEFNDVLEGRGGNDVFVGYGGSDLIIGGSGYDMIDYGPLSGGSISVDLGTGLVSKTGGDVDQLIGMEAVRGTAWNDQFIGNDGTNVFNGNLGDDVADFGRGIDILQIERSFDGFVIDLAARTTSHNVFGYGTVTFDNLEYIQFSDRIFELEEHTNFGSGLGADLLVQDASGSLFFVDTDGLVGSEHFIANAAGRQVLGIGDFNGDATDDIVYRNGNNWYGLLDGAGANTNIGFRSGQSLIAVADLNGDGRDDLLFENDTSGFLAYVRGGDLANVNIGKRVGQTLVATGDFNGDAKTDLLFKNDSSGWLSYARGGDLANVNVGFRPGQEMLSVGDFDGDGRDDVLFRNTSSGWMSYAKSGNGANVNFGYRTGQELLGVGDFDDDGAMDLLFRKAASGWLSYMQGDTGANVNIGFAGNKTLLSIGDYDGDGADDLMFLNNATQMGEVMLGADSADAHSIGDASGLTLWSADFGTNMGDDMFIA